MAEWGDKARVLAAVQLNGLALEYASSELQADRDVVLAAVRQHGWALQHAADELRADRDVALAAVGQDACALEWAAAELWADRDFVLGAVAQHGSALESAAAELQADCDVALAAVRQHGSALRYAAAELQADRDFVIAAVGRNGYALEFAADEMRADRDVVLAAVGHRGYALRYAAIQLRADRDVVLTAVAHDEGALQYASEDLRADRDLVLAAVGQRWRGSALEHAATGLKADRDFVLAAVGLNGYELKHAAAELQADRAVVLAAVGQSGYALQFAAAALQADRDVVLAAVGQSGCALEYAAAELQMDRDVVLAALGRYPLRNWFAWACLSRLGGGEVRGYHYTAEECESLFRDSANWEQLGTLVPAVQPAPAAELAPATELAPASGPFPVPQPVPEDAGKQQLARLEELAGEVAVLRGVVRTLVGGDVLDLHAQLPKVHQSLADVRAKRTSQDRQVYCADLIEVLRARQQDEGTEVDAGAWQDVLYGVQESRARLADAARQVRDAVSAATPLQQEDLDRSVAARKALREEHLRRLLEARAAVLQSTGCATEADLEAKIGQAAAAAAAAEAACEAARGEAAACPELGARAPAPLEPGGEEATWKTALACIDQYAQKECDAQGAAAKTEEATAAFASLGTWAGSLVCTVHPGDWSASFAWDTTRTSGADGVPGPDLPQVMEALARVHEAVVAESACWDGMDPVGTFPLGQLLAAGTAVVEHWKLVAALLSHACDAFKALGDEIGREEAAMALLGRKQEVLQHLEEELDRPVRQMHAEFELALAEPQAAVAAAAQAEAATADFLRRQYPAALQCPQCGLGPVLPEGCGDHQAPHGEAQA